jgi:hypothetical protein
MYSPSWNRLCAKLQHLRVTVLEQRSLLRPVAGTRLNGISRWGVARTRPWIVSARRLDPRIISELSQWTRRCAPLVSAARARCAEVVLVALENSVKACELGVLLGNALRSARKMNVFNPTRAFLERVQVGGEC